MAAEVARLNIAKANDTFCLMSFEYTVDLCM